jgi:hypothetical protein
MPKDMIGAEDDELESEELGIDYAGSDQNVERYMQKPPRVVFNPTDKTKVLTVKGDISAVRWSRKQKIVVIKFSDGRTLKISS